MVGHHMTTNVNHFDPDIRKHEAQNPHASYGGEGLIAGGWARRGGGP